MFFLFKDGTMSYSRITKDLLRLNTEMEHRLNTEGHGILCVTVTLIPEGEGK